jgi:hypothetical protein
MNCYKHLHVLFLIKNSYHLASKIKGYSNEYVSRKYDKRLNFTYM